jgi:RNA-directed DNA polymerase
VNWTGYPAEVARLLTGLCTNAVPEMVWASNPAAVQSPIKWIERQRYQSSHLPQGAPTSPALANLCAYRLDVRLHALAQSAGAIYTRYADDLAFSGGRDLEQSLRRFRMLVYQIAIEEGFEINLPKSRFMRQGARQELTGIVVNSHTNIRRADIDLLKAILTNCARHGPHSQNRDRHGDFRNHLLGRIAHCERVNAARGKKLRELFARIEWETKK